MERRLQPPLYIHIRPQSRFAGRHSSWRLYRRCRK